MLWLAEYLWEDISFSLFCSYVSIMITHIVEQISHRVIMFILFQWNTPYICSGIRRTQMLSDFVCILSIHVGLNCGYINGNVVFYFNRSGIWLILFHLLVLQNLIVGGKRILTVLSGKKLLASRTIMFYHFSIINPNSLKKKWFCQHFSHCCICCHKWTV